MSADLMVFDKSKVPAERLLSRNMNIEIGTRRKVIKQKYEH